MNGRRLRARDDDLIIIIYDIRHSRALHKQNRSIFAFDVNKVGSKCASSSKYSNEVD